MTACTIVFVSAEWNDMELRVRPGFFFLYRTSRREGVACDKECRSAGRCNGKARDSYLGGIRFEYLARHHLY
jgi:hypothetical protein